MDGTQEMPKIKICAWVTGVFFLLMPHFSHAQAQIVSVSPVQNATNVQLNASVTATFDSGMEAATINDSTFFAQGSQSGLHTGTINYNAITRTATLDPSADFFIGEIVAVHLTSAIQDTQGVAFAGFVWHFTVISTNGTGTLKPAEQYACHGNPHGISTADLNVDGVMDLIVANQGTNDYSILFGSGNGGFNDPVHEPTGSEPTDVVCGDLDLDGFTDWVAVTRGDGAVYGYLNDGTGSGTSTGQYSVGTNPLQAILVDFDNDGYLDCATVNNATNDMGVLIGNGDGTFQAVTSYAAGPDPRGLHSGDINEDGWIDIVVTRTANARITLFVNNGDGTFSNSGTVMTGNTPYAVLLASLDTVDNHLDLVSTNSGSNTISVALGDGTGGFAGANSYPTPAAPRNGGITDMDANGMLDIFVSTVGSDSLAIMLNDSSAQFNTYESYYGGDSILRVCTGDFNMDGAMDLAVVCFNEDSVSVFLNALDTLSPYIVSTVPDSGQTDVAVNSDIHITFSEPMDTASIDTTKFYISGSVVPAYTYALAYDTLSHTVLLDPDVIFAANETITVDVASTVADTSGNQMGMPYSFFFVTASSSDTLGPEVISIGISPDTSQGAHFATASGTISDSTTGMSVIQGAEIFFDSIGQNNTGIPLNPVDGSWDEIIEDVNGVVDISSFILGDHWMYLHGFDGAVWGQFDSALLVITPDDDTTGPSFSAFNPDSVPDTSAFHVSCAITDPSGVYDDSTGSSGQGVYLLWDNDGEITVSSQEVQMSQLAADTYQTDVQIPQQNKDADLVYEVYAYDNDFDFNEPDDRTQGQSGLRSIVVYDGRGPITTQVQVSPPNPPPGITEVVVYATISDSTTGGSLIIGGETFIDSIGANGTGFAMQAADGSFNEVYEDVFDTIAVSGWAIGDTHTFYVHGQDENGNWGFFDSAIVIVSGVVDTTGPEFVITTTPAPAYVGDTVSITAIPSEAIDSVVTCSLTTSDTVLVFTLSGDTAGYSGAVITIGYQPGDCYLAVSGYDLSSNYGVTYDTFTISLTGEFLPEAEVYAWPNPARDNIVNFHYFVNANAEITVDVFTIEGKKVTALSGRGEGGRPPHQMDSNALQWNISDIASDVYIFKLTAVSDVDGQTRSVLKKFAIVH